MTLMRDVITIPERVTDSDFVMKLSEGVTHARKTIDDYVVTDSLKRDFATALGLVGQAVQTGRSQAAFLHGSFGSGKSHFMAILHEILVRNPDARAIAELAHEIDTADQWLSSTTVLPLTYHMLGARSVEDAVFGGYRAQIERLRPGCPPPALHRSDRLLEDAAAYRADVGDDKFFRRISGGATGGGSAAWGAYRGGWDATRYASATADAPGTAERDRLVSDLTATLFKQAVHSGEYLDIDTGLAVLTQHAKSLGFDVVVLFLDELVLWLSQHLSNLEFVNEEGGKLAKFVESSDAHRPIPLVSFVARQRDLTAFLGPHVPGAERQAFSDVFRHGRGRYQEIPLEERNLPLIAEKRLLAPKDAGAQQVLNAAFAAVSRRPEIWDTLRLGAQFEDAGIGSDEAVFRRLYPFSPALVATLVALSQALQRERTALKTMLRLLVDRRDTLEVNDLIGVAELFDELVCSGELPDEPALRKHFETARELYRTHLRPLLLRRHSLDEAGAAQVNDAHPFRIDDRLVKTLLLAALVPDVPALHNLTAAKLHALNYGSIASPLPGMEPQIVLGRLRDLAAEAPEIRVGAGPDPVISLELSDVDYQAVLDRVPATEDTPGARRRLLRELLCVELEIKATESLGSELIRFRDWRGRRHQFDVVFGNVRDPDELPEATLRTQGNTWRIIIDYPFDAAGHGRLDDIARVEALQRAGVTGRTVFWLPYYLTEDRLGGVGTLVRLNYALAGSGDRLYDLANDKSPQDRQQIKILLEQQQRSLKERLLECLKQAYGAAAAQPADVEVDPQPVFRSLDGGLRLQNLVGGTMKSAFEHLTGQLLAWSYPGNPHLPEDEQVVRPADAKRILGWVRRAVADETRGVVVDQSDRLMLRRVCNPLRLGELVENKYVLTMTTSHWTKHLMRGAAAEGCTDQFPVSTLRKLIDLPKPLGLDRTLENLIIATFALDRDLGWYQHKVQVTVPPLENITDDFVLRHPPLPEEDAWNRAIRRASALFGVVLPPLRSVANVTDLARRVRECSRLYARDCGELVRLLERHASLLGLDTRAEVGRLATARRVTALLDNITGETDDVVLVELVAAADLGVDDTTASRSMVTARPVAAAVAGTHWKMVEAIGRLTDSRAEAARALLEQLADAAVREQFQSDLPRELTIAVERASELLTSSVTITAAVHNATATTAVEAANNATTTATAHDTTAATTATNRTTVAETNRTLASNTAATATATTAAEAAASNTATTAAAEAANNATTTAAAEAANNATTTATAHDTTATTATAHDTTATTATTASAHGGEAIVTDTTELPEAIAQVTAIMAKHPGVPVRITWTVEP